MLQSLVSKHHWRPTSLSQPLLNRRKCRPRHSQWLSWSCLIFPLSKVLIPTRKTISLWKHWEVESPYQSKHWAVIMPLLYRTSPGLWSRNSLAGVCDPGSRPRSCTHKGPCSWFYALLCQLGILSSFWTGTLCFHFAPEPTKYGSWFYKSCLV